MVFSSWDLFKHGLLSVGPYDQEYALITSVKYLVSSATWSYSCKYTTG